MADISPEARHIITAVMRKKLAEHEKAQKAEFEDSLLPTERRVAMVGETRLGAVTRTKISQSWAVVDDRALLEWAKRAHPEYVRTVTYVDERRIAALLDTAGQTSEPVDPETGEVIPGVELRQGGAYIRALPEPDVQKRITALVESGQLRLQDALELEQ